MREDLADSHANALPFRAEMGAQTAVISVSGVKHVWHLAISKPTIKIVKVLSFFWSLCSVSGETFPRFLLSSYIPVAETQMYTVWPWITLNPNEWTGAGFDRLLRGWENTATSSLDGYLGEGASHFTWRLLTKRCKLNWVIFYVGASTKHTHTHAHTEAVHVSTFLQWNDLL